MQLIGNSHYNNNSANNELLVRNTANGHFYEWWIANSGALTGVDLGAAAGGAAGAAAGGAGADAVDSAGLLDTPAAPASSDPTALMVQAMASFGTGGALNSAPLLNSDPAPQSAFGAAAEPRSAHA
jgi:hypothetical protein